MRPHGFIYGLLCGLVSLATASPVTAPLLEPSPTPTPLAERQAAFPTIAFFTSLTPPSGPDLRAPPATGVAGKPLPPTPAPAPTPIPDIIVDGGLDTSLNPGFVQTTYYSCYTRGTISHCGWYIPIMAVNDAPRPGGEADVVAFRAGLVAAGALAVLAMA